MTFQLKKKNNCPTKIFNFGRLWDKTMKEALWEGKNSSDTKADKVKIVNLTWVISKIMTSFLSFRDKQYAEIIFKLIEPSWWDCKA